MSKKSKILITIVTVVIGLTIFAGTCLPYIPPACYYCSPGYWKNHGEVWQTGYVDWAGYGSAIPGWPINSDGDAMAALWAHGNDNLRPYRAWVTSVLNYVIPHAWTNCED